MDKTGLHRTQRSIFFAVPLDYLLSCEMVPQSIKFQCDDAFFHSLRSEYHKAKGWARRWFGFMTFSYCEFFKVSLHRHMAF